MDTTPGYYSRLHAALRGHRRVKNWALIGLTSVFVLVVASAATGSSSQNAAPLPPAPTVTATVTTTSTATTTATTTATATATATAVPPTNTPVPPVDPPLQPTSTPRPAQQAPALPTSTPIPPPPPAAPPASSSISPIGMDGYARALLDATNVRRASVGLPPLRDNGYLNAIAHLRSQEMADYGYFAHESPVTGENVFALMDKYGVPYGWAGENLAKNNYPDSQTVDVADDALWASPAHHENIVNANYINVGIALVVDASGMKYFTIVFTD